MQASLGASPRPTTIRVWCQIVGDSPRKGDHAGASPVTLTTLLRCRLISRTADFESVNGGASPPAAANRGLGLRERGRLPGREKFRRVRRPQAPPLFGSQALTVKPPALTRQNPERYRGDPPVSLPPRGSTNCHLARWRSRQRSSLIRRRSRVRIPLEPPCFEAWQSSNCDAL